MTSYIDQFLNLRCAADVLEAVHPILRAEKEISESMALISAIRGKCLSEPGEWTVIDACAGNALTGILVAHLLPVAKVIAIDKRQRIREGFGRVQHFDYRVRDINDDMFWSTLPRHSMIVASHPCRDLATKLVSIAISCSYPIAMLPCCVSRKEMPNWARGVAREKGAYFAWLTYLACELNGKFRYDKKCISPCNGLVTRWL